MKSKLELISIDILKHFQIKVTTENTEYLESKIGEYRGGRKYEKVVSFNGNGEQVRVYKSLVECGDFDGLTHRHVSQLIIKNQVCKKNGLRYRKLSSFGNFTKSTNINAL